MLSPRWIFRIVLLAFWVVVGLAAAEWVLRVKERRVKQAEQLEPGLIQYDEALGWKLTPFWTGGHRNADFTVRYRIDGSGFRHDPKGNDALSGAAVAVVGDSFSFGLGVDDDQTFVHHLNVQRAGRAPLKNFSIPGYSTDQEALLIDRLIAARKVTAVFLVVYLANDLIDNQLVVPIQMNLAKPRFLLRDGNLELRNVPVPREPPRDPAGRSSFPRAIYGDDHVHRSVRYRLEQRSRLFQLFSASILPPPAAALDFAARHDAAIELTVKILERIAAVCARKEAGFAIVLLGGRSLIEDPRSISGRYQEYCRSRLVAAGRERRWTVIDAAAEMAAAYREKPATWYFPNDGHLNPEGHRRLARILAAVIGEMPRE